MFRGVSTLNLDSKGRMAVPARYRDLLNEMDQGRVVITADRDRCLLMYPASAWTIIEAKLSALPSMDRSARAIQRLYLGYAQDLEMDSQGRILLPNELRKFANIDRRVVLVGQGDKFELWEAMAWEAACTSVLDNPDLELIPELKSLSL